MLAGVQLILKYNGPICGSQLWLYLMHMVLIQKSFITNFIVRIHQNLFMEIPENSKISEQFLKQAHQLLIQRHPLEFAEPPLQLDYGQYGVISNLPTIKDDQAAQFTKAVKGFLKKNHNIENVEAEVTTDGVAFIQFQSEESAEQGMRAVNGSDFNPKLKVSAYTFKQLQEIEEIGDYRPLLLFQTCQLVNFASDPRPQLSFFQATGKLTIQWFDGIKKKLDPYSEISIQKYRFLKWSTFGTYLVLVDEQGFTLYGTETMQEIRFFQQLKVQNLLFSCKDYYLLAQGENVQQEFQLWDLREQRQLRHFPKTIETTDISTFKFSVDGKFLARIVKDEVLLYDAPNFFQFDQVTAKGVRQILWVGIRELNVLCVGSYPKENETKPTIQLIEINEKKKGNEFPWKTITLEVSSIELFSHHYGQWLGAVIKQRHKQRIYKTYLQIGNLLKRGIIMLPMQDNISVSQVELDGDVDAIFFEKYTGKFALSQREKDKQQKPLDRSIFKLYTVSDSGKNSFSCIPMGTISGSPQSELLWTSNGQYYCLVNKVQNSPDQGRIDFGQIKKKVDKDNTSYISEITKTVHHFYMSHAEWDPTGRYLVTMSTTWSSVNIWSAVGEQLHKDTITKVTEIFWRNRPTRILSLEGEKNLLKDTKGLVAKYEVEDDKILNKEKYDKEQQRREKADTMQAILTLGQKRWEDNQEKISALQGFEDICLQSRKD